MAGVTFYRKSTVDALCTACECGDRRIQRESLLLALTNRMPLFALAHPETPIIELPRRRREFFDTYRPQISDAEYAAICHALNAEFDKHKTFRSSHVPGNVWADGPYEPIRVACGGDEKRAGWLFGLIVWEVARVREDNWTFYKAEAGPNEVEGTLYSPAIS